MARLAISQLNIAYDQDEHFVTSSAWDDPISKLKQQRLSKSHAGGLQKCTQCGTDVKIHVSPKRNPHSGKLGRVVTLKDHDLCRRCWRQIVRSCREAMAGESYHFFEPQERREVA